MPFSSVLPAMVRIRRRFPGHSIPDPEVAARQEMLACGLSKWVSPGDRIAVGCGSRGIASYAQIVRGAVTALRAVGAQPFIVPAMGSHGGATAAGQAAVLAAAGITPESMGVPVVSGMDVVEIGRIPGGPPVYFDRRAAEADGVMVVNRVKPHTDFRGELASGLLKMLAIGFGKEAGAKAIHTYGVYGLKNYIPQVAQVILDQVKVIPGLAIVENAQEHPAVLRALAPHQMYAGEKELLQLAYDYMGKLPVEQLDVLVLDYMGKDISGAGMDTNIIGRLYITGEEEFATPRISRIVVLDLTPASHGNAIGVGMADLITERLRAKIDTRVTNVNTITSTFVERGRIPISLPTDQAAIETALHCAWQPDAQRARVIRARSTLDLSELYVSTAVWHELACQPDIERLAEPVPWQFTPTGDLDMPW